MFDWRNDPVWIGGIKEAHLVTAEPFGVGSRVERVAKFLGKRVEYVNEVVELEPDARLVMRSVKSPFPMVVTYELVEVGGATEAVIRVQGEPSGFYRLAGPLVSPGVRRAVSGDLRRLKRTLEAGATLILAPRGESKRD